MENMMNERKEEGMNQGGGMMGRGMMGGRMGHWYCCVLPILTCLMWIASVVFVVISWVSVRNATGELWGYGPQWWIWNAVMFGILATYGGGRKWGHHGVCKDGVCR